jgi:copper homeostasis protein CutC
MDINFKEKIMKLYCKKCFLIILSVGFLTSCGNLNTEFDKKLNELKNKAGSLDSLVNKEVGKVLILDSIINRENGKVKRLDSLFERSKSRIDSIVNDKINPFKK